MKETKFKDTEVGRIPEDWEEISLGDVGEVKMCKRIMKYQTSDKGDIPFYKIGTFGKSADAFISKDLYESFKSKYNYPKKGDILLSAAGTIGRTVVFNGEPSYFQDSNIVWIENDEHLLSNALLYYIYKNLSWVTESGTIPRIYNSIVKSIKFCIPVDKSEQIRIATALSNIDALISELDRLIEKKRAIKQGAMQQLLTGKKRLKGFSEPWVEKKLGEVGVLTKQSVNPQMFPNTLFSEYSMPAFDNGQSPDFKYGNEMFNNRTVIDGETLLYNKLNVRQKRIWLVKECGQDSICSAEFLAFKSNDIYLDLLKYILSTSRVTKDFIDMSKGTSNSQKRIQPADFLNYSIYFPKSGIEQTAIASVLSSMDNEISALESKKAKYKQIKQGMMQQLLTGKIRLID